MGRLLYLICTVTAVAFASCGKKESDKKLGSLGAPNVGEIVDAATPTGLKEGGQNLQGFPLVCTNCNTRAGFLNYAKSYVFKKSTDANVEATAFYRYWVDVLDGALEEADTRVAGSVEGSLISTCVASDPVEIEIAIAIGDEDVSVTPKLQCFENQETPNGRQDFAFGRTDDEFWLVYRTHDSGTSTGSGARIVIAKATADGEKAEIWFVGGSYQANPGSSTAAYSTSFQRIFADKENKSFTFNSVSDTQINGLVFSSFFGRSNGTKIFMEARTFNPDGNTYVNVSGMEPGTGYCASADDVETEATDCVDLSKAPSGFGYEFPYHNAPYTRGSNSVPAGITSSQLKSAIETISAISYGDAGVLPMAPDDDE